MFNQLGYQAEKMGGGSAISKACMFYIPQAHRHLSLELLHSNIFKKMSECLWTYGPQIIRVPQLQSED